MVKPDAQQARQSGREPIELSSELIEQIKAEMGVADPLVVLVIDKNELGQLGGAVEPFLGHPESISPIRSCEPGEPVQPILAFASSGVCCVFNRKGLFYLGNCWPTPFSC